MCCSHFDDVAVFDDVGGVFGADDTRDAELAGYDSRMAGDASFVRDDGGGAFHEGEEFRPRHACHEHFAVLEGWKICDR